MARMSTSVLSSPKATRGLYYGWVIIMVTAALQFAGGTPTFPVLGLFLKPETAELGWNAAAYSLPLTIGTFLGGLSGAIIGPSMDKYGPRWIMTAAAILVGGCFILSGFVHAYWQYFILAVMTRGVTAGCFFMVVGIVIPRWFVLKRGRATSISSLGGSAGQFLNPIMVSLVISHYGWRQAWFMMGALVLIVALLPVFFFLKNKPEDMGLLPDGLTPEEAARLKAEAAKPQAGKKRVKSLEEVAFTAKEVARTKTFYLMLIAQVCMSLVISGQNFHWFNYLTSRGLSSGVAVASISVYSVASIPASLLAGYFADRFEKSRLILFGIYLGFSFTVVLLIFADTPAMAYAYGISLGLFGGMSNLVNQVTWANYFGRKHLGAIRGVVHPFTQITNASGPLVAAIALDVTGSYTLIWWIFTGIAGVAAFLWLLATPPKPPVANGTPQPAAVIS